MRRLASILLVAALLTLSCEFACFLWMHYIAGVGWVPSYMHPSAPFSSPWLTEDEPWGAWHVANAVSRQEGRCFSAALRSNSVGARDREREVGGDPHRTIVLGDSFVEGFGVEADARLSDLLETRLHREFLNFGATNDFGPLQEQILYDKLASRFAHDHVLVMFLPDNDFTDNDLDYWREYRPDFGRRYRPYYQAAAGGYVPYYPVPDPTKPAADAPPARASDGMGRVLADNSWTVAAYRYLRFSRSRPAGYSGYFDFSDDQLKAVLWSFAQIKQRAGDRAVSIVTIPRRNDFRRVAAAGANRLGEIMERFGRDNGIEVIDLLPLMPTIEPDTGRYFLSCDGHWSPLGNRVAAEVVASRLHF